MFDYWKRKIKMYLGSINDQMWHVPESDYMILDPTNLSNQDKANLCRVYCRVGTSTAYVVVTSTVALYFSLTVSGVGSLSVRL
jgi:hypothetical protein